ncbi:MAG: T9SS type A sorting domain-containing protein [candidate division WOR-3 bacterium]
MNLNFLIILLMSFIYEVGPGKPYENIGDVPLESLNPGDTVRIYYKSTPYYEKWVIGRKGTQNSPIVFQGVPDSVTGNLPVIDGENAVTRLQLDYWSEERGIINVGGSSYPGQIPEYIIIENLEIRKARPPYSFYDDQGQIRYYAENASSIYVVEGDHITVRNCILQDCGNGFFVSHSAKNIVVECCYIYNNGIEGSYYEHNSYTEAQGIIFQFNHFGPLRNGCLGNNLKDRSCGCVIRYNWIEYGNRQLDLVDSDYPEIYNDPSYRKTFVYGNILIEQYDEGNSQIVHYGGDSGDTTHYRHGFLYFYNNTIVSKRTGNTTIFRLSTNLESCDARNNIFYVTASGNRLAMIADYGNLIVRNNWLKTGWVISHGNFQGTFVDSGGIIAGEEPGFLDFINENFHLKSTSPCIDAGAPLSPTVLPDHNVLYQYVKHRSYEIRPYDGIFDIGAYEYSPSSVSEKSKINNKECIVFTNHKGIIFYNLPENALIETFDLTGRLVFKLEKIKNKIYIIPLNKINSGIYFYTITLQNFHKKGKIYVLK